MQTLAQSYRQFWETPTSETDVVIIGGGILGAAAFHDLASRGCRVLLAEQGDFASATSQASALTVWGGLLYLRNLDFFEVFRLARAREELIKRFPAFVSPQKFRFLFSKDSRPHRSPALIECALWAYWILASGKRARPKRCAPSVAPAFVSLRGQSLVYEEAQLQTSDARFVLDLILQARRSVALPLNYSKVVDGRFDRVSKTWELELQNQATKQRKRVLTKWVLNCSGIWTDTVNDSLSLSTPFRHVLGKGVSISVPRHESHTETLVFDSPYGDEGMSLVPWGPVSLWGSTENVVNSIEEGFAATREDINYLLETLNNVLTDQVCHADIISLRCGIRPLAVPKEDRSNCSSLERSKRFEIVRLKDSQAVVCYGGKITSSFYAARKICNYIQSALGPMPPVLPASGVEIMQRRSEMFGKVPIEHPATSWAKEHELCQSIEDFLRRRTNIAQWIPRGGLGANNENADVIRALADGLHGAEGAGKFSAYQQQVDSQHDKLLRSR